MKRGLKVNNLQIDEKSELIWIRVKDALGLLWDRNPKLHGLEDIIESLNRYGLQDKARYDETLAAIKHGNGRIEALAMMEDSGDYEPPRGIAIEKDTGDWCMQIEVGVDAATIEEAMAYAIDANNLTLTGGDIGLTEVMKIWDESIVGMLVELGESGQGIVSIDSDDINTLLACGKGMVDVRPDFGIMVDEFKEGGSDIEERSPWLYIEFYQDAEKWDRLCELLSPYLKGESIHELQSDFFFEMVEAYCGEKDA